jgi:hypothetical protein
MSQYIRRYRPADTTRIGRGRQHFESLVLQIAPLGSDPDKWTTDRITVHIRRISHDGPSQRSSRSATRVPESECPDRLGAASCAVYNARGKYR